MRKVIIIAMLILVCMSSCAQQMYKSMVATKDTIINSYNKEYSMNLPLQVEKWHKFNFVTNDSVKDVQYYFYVFKSKDDVTEVAAYDNKNKKVSYVITLKPVRTQDNKRDSLQNGEMVYQATIRKDEIKINK